MPVKASEEEDADNAVYVIRCRFVLKNEEFKILEQIFINLT